MMRRPPIAISQGDPAGIGPEIIAMAYRDQPTLLQGCFVVGQVNVMRKAAGFLPGLALPVARIGTVHDAWDVPPGCIAVLQAGADEALPSVGVVSAEAGHQAAQAVLWGARAALRGDVSALVTAPLNKEALSMAGVPYPGHTEMLQAEAAVFKDQPISSMPVRMMLANAELRTVLVSIHVSLRDAIEAVTLNNVLETLRITHAALSAMLGRPPRIAVAGLNPHAGEGGLFGREEVEIIQPAVAAARLEGIVVEGPYAPDTVFMRARTGEFDVVIAMYHDQGLIPVKYMGVELGVNVTLGLPLVRTSPDHGTAFDIAGTGSADPRSLIEALRVARQLAGT